MSLADCVEMSASKKDIDRHVGNEFKYEKRTEPFNTIVPSSGSHNGPKQILLRPKMV